MMYNMDLARVRDPNMSPTMGDSLFPLDISVLKYMIEINSYFFSFFFTFLPIFLFWNPYTQSSLMNFSPYIQFFLPKHTTPPIIYTNIHDYYSQCKFGSFGLGDPNLHCNLPIFLKTQFRIQTPPPNPNSQCAFFIFYLI